MKSNKYLRTFLLLALFASWGSATCVWGQGPPRRVQFRRGTHSIIVEGRLRGYEYIDYIMRARSGETIKLLLTPDNLYTGMILYSINGRLTGNAELTEYTGILPEDGEYVVRVLMQRSEARRETVSSFSLYVYITKEPAAKMLPDFVYGGHRTVALTHELVAKPPETRLARFMLATCRTVC